MEETIQVIFLLFICRSLKSKCSTSAENMGLHHEYLLKVLTLTPYAARTQLSVRRVRELDKPLTSLDVAMPFTAASPHQFC